MRCLGRPRCCKQSGDQQERDAGDGGGDKGETCPVPTGRAQCPAPHTRKVPAPVGLLGCPSTTVAEGSLRDPPAPVERGHPRETASFTGTPPSVSKHPTTCMHGPPRKYTATCPPRCCAGQAALPGACGQMGHSRPQPQVPPALLGRHPAILM